MRYCSLDDLLPLDHPVRTVWAVVQTLDLSAFKEPIKSRQHSAGRSAIDPQLLVALWLHASTEGVAGGRRLAELCESHIAYQWLCGGVGVNYHTLNDFRVGHAAALDALFTQVLGRLTHAGLVTIHRICQDGLRVRASAGFSSFHRRKTLLKCLAEARLHLAELNGMRDESPALGRQRQESQQQFQAEDRARRIREALAAEVEVDVSRRNSHKRNKKKKISPARASVSDPESRMMKMPDGGFRPAYNLQFASDPVSRAIVGVQATNAGADATLLTPMREQVLQRTGTRPREHLADGGYVSIANLKQARKEEVTLYMPVPEPRNEEQDRFARRKKDTRVVADWRRHMGTTEAQAIYLQRLSTCEPINADLRTWRGLGRLAVRGLAKVQCVALWSALTYNLLHFGAALLKF